MRFIHTADIHLDSPLHGLASYPDAPASQLRSATRDAFSELVNRAVDERVDFMVIAGDLYDGTWRDHNTGIFFCKEMGRLKRAGIRVFVLFGNHDAESEMTRKLDLPDNVRCFSAKKAETLTLDDLHVALHGQSFMHKETTENLAAGYPAAVPGYYNIGVLHTALEGNTVHANYAPCSRDELHVRGYDYWALGHVHEYAMWNGSSTIVFPGNLQGRNIRETGRRGAVLVTVSNQGRTDVERLYLDVLRWEAIAVDAAECASLLEVCRKVGRALEDLLSTDGHVPRAVRVTIGGRSKAHGELFGLESQLRSEVLASIASIGNEKLWLEKVRVETQAFSDAAMVESRLDAFAELSEILRETEQDPEFLKELKDELGQFVAKVPLELQSLVPALQWVRSGQLEGLVKTISPGLLAHLARSE